MHSVAIRRLFVSGSCAAVAAWLSACATQAPEVVGETRNQVIISVRDQKLTVIRPDHRRVTFPISTSKYGLGDRRGTWRTPVGELEVAQKIGAGAAPGTVFHGRVSTGEIVSVDAPGRDAIVTRILALRGLENGNKDAFSRGIYIHGTPEERNIGKPVSYGCIRMRSKDVIQLFDLVKLGAKVQVIDTTMPQALASNIITSATAPVNPPPATQPSDTPGGGAAAGAPPSEAAAQAKPGAKPAFPDVAAALSRPANAAPAASAASKPAANAKKEWAGTPAKLLAKSAEDKTKRGKPNGAVRPVSNNSDENNGL